MDQDRSDRGSQSLRQGHSLSGRVGCRIQDTVYRSLDLSSLVRGDQIESQRLGTWDLGSFERMEKVGG